MKLNVAIIGTVGIPAKYGGFETLAEQLVTELHTDFNFTTYCSSLFYKEKEQHPLTKRIFIPLNANGKSSILYDLVSIIHALFYSDTLLILGVSAGFMIPFVRLFTNKTIITNIDGLEWKRQKWNRLSQKYLKYQEKIAVKYSHQIVADNKAIKEYILDEYNKNSILIAYGGNHVSKFTKKNKTEKYAFSVCRIEPENNIHVILEAFSKTDYKLIFVGNWQANEYGKKLVKKYTHFKNIILKDPIYDLKKLDNLRANAKLYIHGHSAGGTNPSLAEAMWLQLPIFCFDVIYNRESTNNKALYFKDEDSLLNLLQTPKETLLKMAENLKDIAQLRYNWRHVANDYKKLLNRGCDLTSPISKITITASIVVYDSNIDILSKAINSFLSSKVDKKLFLIDNSSKDTLKGKFEHPEIEYLYLGKNLGYGKANNAIIDKIKNQSKYHLILNPDVYFDENVINDLIQKHQEHPNVAIVSPKTLYPNGKFQDSIRRYPSFLELIFRRLHIFKSITDKGIYKDINTNEEFNPDFIQGAFLLFKTKDFVEINGFDERFFMYMEDVDICRKVESIGKRKLYVPSVHIFHHTAKGSTKNFKLFLSHFNSIIKYFYKWNLEKN